MNIRNTLNNLNNFLNSRETPQRRQTDQEIEFQTQERLHEEIAQALEEDEVSARLRLDPEYQTSGIIPVFSDHIVRTIENRNHRVFEIDLNKNLYNVISKVDSKNKFRKIFGSEDV